MYFLHPAYFEKVIKLFPAFWYLIFQTESGSSAVLHCSAPLTKNSERSRAVLFRKPCLNYSLVFTPFSSHCRSGRRTNKKKRWNTAQGGRTEGQKEEERRWRIQDIWRTACSCGKYVFCWGLDEKCLLSNSTSQFQAGVYFRWEGTSVLQARVYLHFSP